MLHRRNTNVDPAIRTEDMAAQTPVTFKVNGETPSVYDQLIRQDEEVQAPTDVMSSDGLNVYKETRDLIVLASIGMVAGSAAWGTRGLAAVVLVELVAIGGFVHDVRNG